MIQTTFRVSAINANGEPAMNDFNIGEDSYARAKAMFDANVQSGQWVSVFLMARTVAFAEGRMEDTGFKVVQSFTPEQPQ